MHQPALKMNQSNATRTRAKALRVVRGVSALDSINACFCNEKWTKNCKNVHPYHVQYMITIHDRVPACK